MPQRQGQYFDCIICGQQFYRRPSHVRRGITKTCGKPECISKASMREQNPFWGKTHTQEVRAKITQARTGITSEGHTVITETLRSRWEEARDATLSKFAAGENKPRTEFMDEPRYLVKFTRHQKRTWVDKSCAYCGRTDNLVLDHIIPVSCGGTNVKHNAQTLCLACNNWKRLKVDTPMYFAMLGVDRG